LSHPGPTQDIWHERDKQKCECMCNRRD
jgi:hypothetical protein